MNRIIHYHNGVFLIFILKMYENLIKELEDHISYGMMCSCGNLVLIGKETHYKQCDPQCSGFVKESFSITDASFLAKEFFKYKTTGYGIYNGNPETTIIMKYFNEYMPLYLYINTNTIIYKSRGRCLISTKKIAEIIKNLPIDSLRFFNEYDIDLIYTK